MRQTKEFITPGGHKVVLNTYLTGREASQLKEIMYSGMKMDISDVGTGGSVSIKEISGSFLAEQEKQALAFLLISVDGEDTNINGEPMNPIGKLLNLPSTEYEAVIKEINNIQNPTVPAK